MRWSDPAGASEGPLVVCNDGLDNDSDGVFDLDASGCRGKRTGTDGNEPRAGPFDVRGEERRCRPTGWAIKIRVSVFSDRTPKRLFPFADVEMEVQGIAGPARSLHKTRRLPLGRDAEYLFKDLRRGRYRVSGHYIGYLSRLASAAATRTIRLSRGRCRVYFAVTDRSRSDRPRSFPHRREPEN